MSAHNDVTPIKNHFQGTLTPQEQELAQRMRDPPTFMDGFSYVLGSVSFFCGSKMWKQIGTVAIPVSTKTSVPKSTQINIKVGIGGAVMGVVSVVMIGIMVALIVVGSTVEDMYYLFGIGMAILYIWLILLYLGMMVTILLTALAMYPLSHFYSLTTEEVMKNKPYKFKCFQECKCPDVLFFYGKMYIMMFLVQAFSGLFVVLFYIPVVNIIWSVILFIFVAPMINGISLIGMAYNSRGGTECDLEYIFSPFQFSFKHWKVVWGIGLATELLSIVPFVNLIMPFCSIVGTTRFLMHYFYRFPPSNTVSRTQVFDNTPPPVHQVPQNVPPVQQTYGPPHQQQHHPGGLSVGGGGGDQSMTQVDMKQLPTVPVHQQPPNFGEVVYVPEQQNSMHYNVDHMQPVLGSGDSGNIVYQ